MNEVKFQTWDDFDGEIRNIVQRHRQYRVDATPFEIYFRGQSDASWRLKTTLERFVKRQLSVLEYFKMIDQIRYRIETFTGQKWRSPSQEEVDNWLSNLHPNQKEYFPDFEFMTYLRHHGYPSPFLDWTESPYVAAYLAFRDVTSASEAVAIYYLSIPTMGKVFPPYLDNTPNIFILDNQVQTNRRHYLQQSVYSICIEQKGEQHFYSNHEDLPVMESFLTKYVLPASERVHALTSLDRFNLNAYSLWGTEESLLETMYLRSFLHEKIVEEQLPFVKDGRKIT